MYRPAHADIGFHHGYLITLNDPAISHPVALRVFKNCRKVILFLPRGRDNQLPAPVKPHLMLPAIIIQHLTALNA